ncbi:MAG: 1,4-alpha-glucan branching enzyme, partial [Chloroflexota bacterium]
MTTLSPETIAAITGGYHGAPFDVLGQHLAPGGLVVRTFQPQATQVTVVTEDDGARPMEQIHPDGFFEAAFPGQTGFFHYRLKITLPDGR